MHAYKMVTDPSYRRESTKKDKRNNLHIKVTMPVSFEDRFFGKQVVLSYNQMEVNLALDPVLKEHQDIITVKLDLPIGCPDNHEMRFSGKGLKCGQIVGDLIVLIAAAPHPRFKMQGLDVFTEDRVPLETMLKGGEAQVQTMYGLKTVWVPAGSKPGDKIKIKNCGVNYMGFHVAELEPIFPTQDQLKNETWKGLDINWEGGKDPDQEFEDAFKKIRGL